MKIFVKAKPNSNYQSLEEVDGTHFVVAVKEAPIRGEANQAIVKILAGYFNIPISKVRLIKGFRERSKIFEIDKMVK